MKAKKQCDVPGCEDDASCAGKCKLHYNYAWRWSKSLAKAHKHKEKLRMRATILDDLVPVADTGRVVQIQSHPRFKSKARPTAQPRLKRKVG